MHPEDSPTPSDETRIQEVLALAAENGSIAYPGPMDACLIVCPSGLVVHASTTNAGEPCLMALAKAGESARGATAYTVLEPSTRRDQQLSGTMASVDALLNAGVARVVGCVDHFDPAFASHGYDALRKAGVEVKTGVHGDAGRSLNRAYIQWQRSRLPYVSVLARSQCDGTNASGRRAAKHGELATADISEYLRHAHDAILIDCEQVASNPDELFLDTSGLPRSRKLLRLIYDPDLSINPDSELVASWDNDLLLLAAGADPDRVDAVRGVGIGVETFSAGQVPNAWRTMLTSISDIPVQKLLVEASNATIAALLDAQLVNEVITIAPPGVAPDVIWAQWLSGKASRFLPIPPSTDRQVTAYVIAEMLS